MSLSSLTQAKGKAEFYQVDLLLFSHQSSSPVELSRTVLSSNAMSAIPLRIERAGTAPYHLLPAASSQLQQEYWALTHKPPYQVLLHYSWLQPFTNKRSVILPKISRNNWQVEGTIRIRRANYYLLDTELLVSTLDNATSFILAQKQRLKGEQIYYLDHPQVGMLIKIHQVV